MRTTGPIYGVLVQIMQPSPLSRVFNFFCTFTCICLGCGCFLKEWRCFIIMSLFARHVFVQCVTSGVCIPFAAPCLGVIFETNLYITQIMKG